MKKGGKEGEMRSRRKGREMRGGEEGRERRGEEKWKGERVRFAKKSSMFKDQPKRKNGAPPVSRPTNCT